VNNEKKTFQKLAFAFFSVTEVFISTIVGLLVGWGFDTLFIITKPWLTVFFVFLGLSAGFYRLSKNYLRETHEK